MTAKFGTMFSCPAGKNYCQFNDVCSNFFGLVSNLIFNFSLQYRYELSMPAIVEDT